MVGAATDPGVLAVTAAALATALATGLGALPLAFARRATRFALSWANAAAAALMLAASGMLFVQGGGSDVLNTMVGGVVGLLAIALAAHWLGKRESWRFEALRGAHARTAVMLVAVMTVHSMAEGIGVGVAFGGGDSLGFLTALAIGVHNIPEGLAISLVLVPRGVSVLHAAGWSVFTSLPQPVLALPAFIFVEAFSSALPFGLGFAGGAMTWMVFARILPDARRVLTRDQESTSVPLA
jgi:zinc transporter, ZIP family